jgi:dTDP-4-dehydrorhamnose reductase
MLYVSSNEVFGGERSEPYREEDAPNPINSYGRSKLEGERWVQSILSRYYIVRTAWLYGGGNDFPAKILWAAAREGALRVVSDEVASPTWAAHLAQAMARLILRPAWGIYHLTNSGHCSRLDWARRTLELAGLGAVAVEETSQERFGAPYRKPVSSVLGNYNAARLGIELPTWEEALQEYLAGSRASSSPVSR